MQESDDWVPLEYYNPMQPDPFEYIIVTGHESTAGEIAYHLQLPQHWEFLRTRCRLRGRTPKRTRLILDTDWLYTWKWNNDEDFKAEEVLAWVIHFPRTVRVVNSSHLSKGVPSDILQASQVQPWVVGQHEPSQNWAVQDSRGVFSGSQVHFSENSRGDLQRCFTYDGKDVSCLVQRAESRYLMEPRRRVSYADYTGTEATVQPEPPTTTLRYWLGVDCGGRVRKKK